MKPGRLCQSNKESIYLYLYICAISVLYSTYYYIAPHPSTHVRYLFTLEAGDCLYYRIALPPHSILLDNRNMQISVSVESWRQSNHNKCRNAITLINQVWKSSSMKKKVQQQLHIIGGKIKKNQNSPYIKWYTVESVNRWKLIYHLKSKRVLIHAVCYFLML